MRRKREREKYQRKREWSTKLQEIASFVSALVLIYKVNTTAKSVTRESLKSAPPVRDLSLSETHLSWMLRNVTSATLSGGKGSSVKKREQEKRN